MKLYKNIFKTILLFAVFVSLAFNFIDDRDVIEQLRNNDITDEEIYQHIKYLASDKLEGRFPGTIGDSLAQAYIVREFKEYGLKPMGDNGFIQNFDMVTKLQLGENNKLEISIDDKTGSFEVGEYFNPFGFSENGIAEGELVFVGYGITAPEQNYNDYLDKDGKEIDLNGKILIALRYSPGYNDPADNPFQQYESERFKIVTPRDESAAGIIFVTGPESDNLDNLVKLRYDKIAQNSGIPIIHAKREIIERIFKSNGLDLGVIQKEIDETQSPNSFVLENCKAKFETSVEPANITTGNILGLLEGNDPELKDEIIVIGAHYDHLGYGQYGSLYFGKDKQIHNGADDNASGTVGVLELAQKLSANKENIERSVLFMCFGGEEAGLLGSSYFVNSDIFANMNIIAMINMDMIGRLSDDKLIIYGTGTSPYWDPKINELNENFNFDIIFNKAGFGASDHSNFYVKDIPVLHFFTGLHSDYHRPIDDYDKINSEGQEKVLKMIYDLAYDINLKDSKIEFVKVKESDKEKSKMGNFRVYVGTIPDFSSKEEGYKISGVKPESPAENGGLQGGDVIIKFGSLDIKNIYDFTYGLKIHKPDDVVDVIVLRDGEEVLLRVILGRR